MTMIEILILLLIIYLVIKLAPYLLCILLIPLMMLLALVFWCSIAVAWTYSQIRTFIKPGKNS